MRNRNRCVPGSHTCSPVATPAGRRHRPPGPVAGAKGGNHNAMPLRAYPARTVACCAAMPESEPPPAVVRAHDPRPGLFLLGCAALCGDAVRGW